MGFGEMKQMEVEIKSAEQAASFLASRDFIRRAVYPSAVERYVKELEEDGSFLVPLTCNTWNGHPYVIDGQHRMQAIQKLFERGRETPVRVPIVMYRGLNVEKMKELYAKLSMQKPQQPSDKILVNTQGTKIFEMLTMKLPSETGLDVQITKARVSKNQFLYSTLLLAYYQAKSKLMLDGVEYNKVAKEMAGYNEIDYSRIKSAVAQYMQIHMSETDFTSHRRFRGIPYLRTFIYLHLFLRKKGVPTNLLTNAILSLNERKINVLHGEFKHIGGRRQTMRWNDLLANNINRKLKKRDRIPLRLGVGGY